MPRFKIPEKQLAALEELAAMPDPDMEQLVRALDATAPALTPVKFFVAVSSKTTGLDKKKIEVIVEALCGLSYLKERRHLTIEELTDAIIEAAGDKKREGSQLIPTSRASLQTRLDQLLGFEKSIGVTAKALDVMTGHDKIFCNVRILSDIRAVFTGSAESATAGFVVHNLSIAYHQNKEHKELFFALDVGDLKLLKDAIARAEQKEEFLKGVFTKSGIQYLDVD